MKFNGYSIDTEEDLKNFEKTFEEISVEELQKRVQSFGKHNCLLSFDAKIILILSIFRRQLIVFIKKIFKVFQVMFGVIIFIPFLFILAVFSTFYCIYCYFVKGDVKYYE